MKTHAIFYLLLLSNSLISFAQTPFIDSLRLVYLNQTDKEQTVRHQFTFAKSFLVDLPDSAIYHAHIINAASEKIGFKKGLAFAQELLSKANHNKGEYELAIQAHQKHIAVQLELGDTLSCGMILQQMGQEYQDWGFADKAMETYFEALEFFEQKQAYDNIGSVYNDIGNILRDEERFDEALAYYKKGLIIRKQHSPEEKLYYSYSNLGNVYDDMGQSDSSFYYSHLALDLAIKYENHISEAIEYINIGFSHRQLEQYEEAESYYLKALKILKPSPYNDFLISLYINLATVMNASDHPNKALNYLLEAQPFVEKTNSITQKQRVKETYARIYENLHLYEKAYHYLDEANLLQDSIDSNTSIETIEGLNIKYQTQKKETELANSKLEIEKKSSQNKQLLLGGIILFLLLSGLFLYLRNRLQSKKQKAELGLQLEKTEAERLREMDKIKSNFFANISHEFRTPLTLILGPLKQMQEGSLKGNTDKYQKIMIRNVERLMNLVNQLLDLSKLESGKMVLKKENADIVKTIRAMAYSFESLAERKEINYEVNLPEGNIIASYDKDKLEKILVNLLSNAFKYTAEKGKVSIEMSIESETDSSAKDMAIIHIKDTGIGISEEELPHIFERFFQTTHTSDIQASSGIGLALTKELVELHNGKIELVSELNQGTQIILHIPIGPTDLLAGSYEIKKNIIAKDSERTVNEAGFLGELKTNISAPLILVVEDNEDVRMYIKDQLIADFRIIEAVDGQEGFQTALELIPDLIISDVMMPNMNGIDMCKRLKLDDKTSHIPVIMLTAKAEREDKIEGLNVGANDYLLKPFDAEELIVRVHNLIKNRRKLQASFDRGFEFRPESISINSVDVTFLSKIKTCIEENLHNETFSVVELSKAANMSRSQLHRKLKAMVNKSPNQIISSMRLLRAKDLLEKNAGNASEVAYMVGFSSLAYFSKCYQDEFGVRPSKVR